MGISQRVFAAAAGLLLICSVTQGAMAQSTGTPVPPPGAPNTLTGPGTGDTTGSGANNSKPVGGPALTGTPHVKTHKRHNTKMYGKHYNVNKHSKR
jgi:hypothetical protein